MNIFKQAWYLIYTKPKQERKVVNQFCQLDVTAYVPLMKETKQWSDRLKVVIKPMFPSYVFVRLTSTHDYYKGFLVEGVCNFIKFNNKAVCVSDEEIQYIRMLEKNGKDIEVSQDYFKRGQQLLIQEGPLNGMSCEMIRYKGKDRILVRVNTLQRSIVADVPAGTLCSASSQE